MKKLMLICAAILSSSALGHPGHGPAGAAHELAHALWMVEALVVLTAVLALGGRWLGGRR